MAHDAFVDFAGATRQSGGVHRRFTVVDLWRDTSDMVIQHGYNKIAMLLMGKHTIKTMEHMERTTMFNEHHHAING